MDPHRLEKQEPWGTVLDWTGAAVLAEAHSKWVGLY